MSYKNKLTAKEQEREFIIECIHLYRNLPTLWNVKCKEYHNRDKKSKAYYLLLNKYKEMYPQATKDDVKKKFNSLRTNYRKELKKRLHSVKSESGSDDLYEPTLWYYSEMDFLQNQECASDSQSSIDLESIQVSGMDVEDKYENVSDTTSQFSTYDAVPKKESTTNLVSRRKIIKMKKKDVLVDLAYKRLKETTDEYRHWAMACAADLQKMEQKQQIYAKKAIAEILMEGRLGLLHRNSLKINDPLITHYSNPPSVVSVQYSSSPSPTYASNDQNVDELLNNKHTDSMA